MDLFHLKSFISQFNPELDSYVRTEILKQKHPVISNYLSQILPLSQGGKRVRPYLCHLMDSPENYSQNLGIYLGLELIHLFALIHDDIMDECDTRRGEETVHSYTRKHLANLGDQKSKLVSESVAILAGDLVFSFAEKAFNSNIKHQSDPKVFIEAYDLFAQLKEEVIYGQLLDVYLSSQSEASEQDVYDKTFYKTASYTIIKPMQIGCILGGRSDLLDFCSAFGEKLGLGFQIQDDYFNLTLTEQQTGKPQYTDILENQKTVFTSYLSNHSDKTYKDEINSFIGKISLSESDKDTINTLLNQSGVLQYGKELFIDYFRQAEKLLEQQKNNLSENTYNGLQELLSYLLNRKN